MDVPQIVHTSAGANWFMLNQTVWITDMKSIVKMLRELHQHELSP